MAQKTEMVEAVRLVLGEVQGEFTMDNVIPGVCSLLDLDMTDSKVCEKVKTCAQNYVYRRIGKGFEKIKYGVYFRGNVPVSEKAKLKKCEAVPLTLKGIPVRKLGEMLMEYSEAMDFDPSITFKYQEKLADMAAQINELNDKHAEEVLRYKEAFREEHGKRVAAENKLKEIQSLLKGGGK